MFEEDEPELTTSEAVDALQNVLISCATGAASDDPQYKTLRQRLLKDPIVGPLLPRYIKTCRDLAQFWAHIKPTQGYQARRELIWGQFRPILERLEQQNPADSVIGDVLHAFNPDTVRAAWQRALDRRATDPEAAITAARTLLETTCKHILDSDGVQYQDSAELPQLYRATATHLRLAPDQHTEQVFKQILGGCQTVVEGLGAIRNRLGDAHGKGKARAKPGPRHAQLAVNLAGAMALFLIETWQSRNPAG
jgi:hypothetical protein